jgi:CRP/FNR family transcriptional regulator, dissimilatory nitrate respiration regulator
MLRRSRRQLSAEVLLKSQPIFKSVPASVIKRLAAAATRRPLTRGERLFSKGDTPTGIYIVIYGSMRLISPSPRGDRLTSLVPSGRSFGEPIMFLNRPALVHAIAAEDSLVLHLPREAVVGEIEANPAFAMHMIGTLSQRVEGLVQQMESQAAGGARERLVRYLIRQAPLVPPHVVILASTKASIATQLLMTPVHFSRLLRELIAEELVEVDGRAVTILDLQRLACE